MKKYFKGRFFYIITTLALIFTIVPTVLSSMGLGFIFRDMVGVVLTPAQKLFNYATEGIDGFVSYFYKFDELVEENTRLREEVSSLQTKIYDSAEVEEMYNWMSDFLEMKMAHNDFQFLAATVTGRESGNYSKILTLDVGSGAGVSVGMPIITAEGIVGQVTEVGYNWSKVTTIIEANSSVARISKKQRTRESARVRSRSRLTECSRCSTYPPTLRLKWGTECYRQVTEAFTRADWSWATLKRSHLTITAARLT